MIAEKTVLNIAKLLILFAILYFLWITVLGPSLSGTQTVSWLVTFNMTYDSALQNIRDEVNDSLVNGTQFNLQDINASIMVASNGTVYANVSSYTNNTYNAFIYIYNRIGWRYMCINSIFLNRQNPVSPKEQICNDTHPSFSERYLEAASNAMSLSLPLQEEQNVVFAIPMNINRHGGVVYSLTDTTSPSDEYLSNLLDTNPTSIYGINSFYENTTSIIDFKENTTKCLRFAILRFSRVRVNVTMPGPIINYVIPKEFLNESVIGSNYVYVDYNSHPCCGVQKSDKIEVEVCA